MSSTVQYWRLPAGLAFFPELLIKETLYCFRQGLKVAMGVALAGVSCGYLIPYQDVIGVGGSGHKVKDRLFLSTSR